MPEPSANELEAIYRGDLVKDDGTLGPTGQAIADLSGSAGSGSAEPVVYTFVANGVTPGANEIELPAALAPEPDVTAKLTRTGDTIVAEGRLMVVGTPAEIALNLPAAVGAEDAATIWVFAYSGGTSGPGFATIYDLGGGVSSIHFTFPGGSNFENGGLICLGGIVYTATPAA